MYKTLTISIILRRSIVIVGNKIMLYITLSYKEKQDKTEILNIFHANKKKIKKKQKELWTALEVWSGD